MPEFEFDPEKSRINLEKHGMDFESATNLWEDERAAVLRARTEDEIRFALIAEYRNQSNYSAGLSVSMLRPC